MNNNTTDSDKRDIAQLGSLSMRDIGSTFARLLPEREERSAVLRILIDLLTTIQNQNNRNWSVSYSQRADELRVVCGFYRIFVLRKNTFRVRLRGSDLNDRLKQLIAEAHGKVAQKQLSEKHIGAIADVELPTRSVNVFESLRNPFYELVRLSSDSLPSTCPWRSHFEPVVIEWLNNTMDADLDQPDYIQGWMAGEDTLVDRRKSRNYYWLNCSPQEWDLRSLPVGGEHTYRAYNDDGNKRRMYKHIQALNPGDLLIGYETSPARSVAALLEVTTPLTSTDGNEAFSFRKIENAPTPTRLDDLKTYPELENAEPFNNIQGSLFHLTAEEFNLIADAAGFEDVDVPTESVSEPGPDIHAFIKDVLSDTKAAELIGERAKADIEARGFFDRHVGSMSSDEIDEFLTLANYKNRFFPALSGYLKARLIENPDAFNKWTAPLWSLDEEELWRHLDRFWSQTELRGGGVSLPSVILYLRDQHRFGIWIKTLQEGLRKIGYDVPDGFRTATQYRQYTDALLQFQERYDLEPEALDYVLWKINTEYNVEETPVSEPNQPKTIESVAAETGFREAEIQYWLDAIERKGQAILYGPPGTGKTFLARKLAAYLVSQGGGGFSQLIQFHPEYAYEDFMQGLRPRLS